MASKTQNKIITLEKDDDIYHHFFDEKPEVVITLGGPYPFTKLRIILATALGFAAGHDVPCHFIKTFDFLNYVFPGYFFALETRRGDFFTFHEKEGEQLMSFEEMQRKNYPIITDDITGAGNLAEKMIEFYPQAQIMKEAYYFYTPAYQKTRIKEGDSPISQR